MANERRGPGRGMGPNTGAASELAANTQALQALTGAVQADAATVKRVVIDPNAPLPTRHDAGFDRGPAFGGAGGVELTRAMAALTGELAKYGRGGVPGADTRHRVESAGFEREIWERMKALETESRVAEQMKAYGFNAAGGKAGGGGADGHRPGTSVVEQFAKGAGLNHGAVGSMASAFGGGGGLGRAGAVAEAVKQGVQEGMHYYAQLGQIDATPFLSDRAREQAQMGAVPIFGDAYQRAQGAVQYFTGESRWQRAIAERDAVRPAELQGRMAELRYRAFDVTEADAARERSWKIGGVTPVEPKGYDRGTVLGKRLYEEEMRTLPQQQELRKAIAERSAAEYKAAQYTKLLTDPGSPVAQRERELRERKGRIEEGLEQAGRRGGTSADGMTEKDLLSQKRDVFNEISELNGIKMQIAERAKAARDEADALKGRENQVRIQATARADYDKAVNREARVESQAERLGRMGFVDRQLGEQAAQMVKANKGNLDMLPQEWKDRAEQFAPEMMQKLYKEEGERHLGRAGGVSDEYDQPSRQQARRNTDEAAKNLRQKEVEAASEAADAYSKGLTDFVEKIAPLIKQANQDAVNKLRIEMQTDAFLRASSVNHPGAR